MSYSAQTVRHCRMYSSPAPIIVSAKYVYCATAACEAEHKTTVTYSVRIDPSP